MVPPCSDRVSRAPPYSRIPCTLRIRGYHPLWPAFPCRSASLQKTTGLLRFRSPLLAESPLMSVPPGTEMFQFPGFASWPYVFRPRYPIGVGCPIRTPGDQSPLAAPPRFSQRATSFIASWRQGIHPMPFSFSHQHAGQNPRALKPHHAQEPSTPETKRFKSPSHSKANSLSTHSNAPEHCDSPALGAKRSLNRTRHPGQTTHAKPSRTSRLSPEPHRPPQGEQSRRSPPRRPARPETHQNLIHNP